MHLKTGPLEKRGGLMLGKNSIAFGSTPRREADSQPISQPGRQADRQTETHSLGFFIGGLGYKQWGARRIPEASGRVVKHSAANNHVGGLIPNQPTAGQLELCST